MTIVGRIVLLVQDSANREAVIAETTLAEGTTVRGVLERALEAGMPNRTKRQVSV
jgi:hypothetical protein